jgi:hypothetical protein
MSQYTITYSKDDVLNIAVVEAYDEIEAIQKIVMGKHFFILSISETVEE